MSKPKAPAAPQTEHVNQYTPLGSMTWGDTFSGPPGSGLGDRRWSSTVTLNPQIQETLDTQLGLSNDVSKVAQGQLPNIEQQYSQPMNLQGVDDIYNKAYGAITPRLDERFGREEESLRNRLANQGLASGGQAFDTEMRNFGQSKNDAYQQANLAAIQTMPQTYQLENAAYMQPLSTFNALRTGSQPQMPQFGNQTTGNQQYQHGLDTYNAQMGNYNAMLGGLAALGAGAFAMSDRRLKSNIIRVGTHPLGVGVYEYDLFGERERGVMAQEIQEVMPEAVVELPSGYLGVRYDLIGGRP